MLLDRSFRENGTVSACRDYRTPIVPFFPINFIESYRTPIIRKILLYFGTKTHIYFMYFDIKFGTILATAHSVSDRFGVILLFLQELLSIQIVQIKVNRFPRLCQCHF